MNRNSLRTWCRLPPLLQWATRLSCTLIVVLVVALLCFDRCGLDRTGTKLIRAGFAADPGLDAVQTAIEQADEGALRRALRRRPPPDLDALDQSGRCPLARAARDGWAPGCRLLLEAGADAGRVDEDDFSPLLYATLSGGSGETAGGGAVVDLLIRHGADVNQRGRGGNTPLLYAAFAGNLGQLTRLIRAGADVNARNDRGYTALHAAAMCDGVPIVNVLLAAGADAAALDDAGQTPLTVARAQGSPGAARAVEAALTEIAARRPFKRRT